MLSGVVLILANCACLVWLHPGRKKNNNDNNSASMHNERTRFIVLPLQQEVYKTTEIMLMTSLMLSGVVTGVHNVMVSVKDEMYRGNYVLYETAWTGSATCKTAGFFFVLSIHVSALSLALMALNSVLNVCSLKTLTFFFNKTFTGISCAVIWLLGFVLSAIPLLPTLSHWKFYQANSICIPLTPPHGDAVGGDGYVLAVQNIFFIILSLFVLCGQMYRHVDSRRDHAHSLLIQSASSTRHNRKINNIVFVNIFCWTIYGLSGLATQTGASSLLSPVLMGLGLSVPAMLNPFLYFVNHVKENMQRETEERMLRMLHSRIATKH
jgi:hypothetical protein